MDNHFEIQKATQSKSFSVELDLLLILFSLYKVNMLVPQLVYFFDTI